MNFFSWLFGRRTVAAITQNLGKMVDSLEAHAKKMKMEIEMTKADVEAAFKRHQEELNSLQAKINDHVYEKDKAEKISANVKALLG